MSDSHDAMIVDGRSRRQRPKSRMQPKPQPRVEPVVQVPERSYTSDADDGFANSLGGADADDSDVPWPELPLPQLGPDQPHASPGMRFSNGHRDAYAEADAAAAAASTPDATRPWLRSHTLLPLTPAALEEQRSAAASAYAAGMRQRLGSAGPASSADSAAGQTPGTDFEQVTWWSLLLAW